MNIKSLLENIEGRIEEMTGGEVADAAQFMFDDSYKDGDGERPIKPGYGEETNGVRRLAQENEKLMKAMLGTIEKIEGAGSGKIDPEVARKIFLKHVRALAQNVSYIADALGHLSGVLKSEPGWEVLGR